MPEHDALVFEYSHLKNLTRGDEALQKLRKIASLVKPIMRARSWRVGVLAEFFPSTQNLLGINQNRGQKICLRLRYPGDKNQFLPMDQVIDTMLHELAHNEIGPHNEQFHALWDQLRKEYEGLIAKGYTGEGFLSEGHRLGGGRIPMSEARRVARAAAERRRNLSAGSGQRLGGRPVLAGTDIRQVITDAIERRSTVIKGCGAERTGEKEIIDLTNEALFNGFKTKAEEDQANERAIAQAMWELVQEDQKKEYGEDYIAPTPENPAGNGNGTIGASKNIKKEPPPVPLQTKPTLPKTGSSRQPPKHVSRLVSEAEAKKKPKSSTEKDVSIQRSKTDLPDSTSPEPHMSGWTCEICTLYNPLNFLCCDACGTERPSKVTQQVAEQDRKAVKTSQSITAKSGTWTCRRCTTAMEDKWWTCSTCGTMKASS